MERTKSFKDFLKGIRNHRAENHWDVTYDITYHNDNKLLEQFTYGALTDFINKTESKVKIDRKNISIDKDDLALDIDSLDKSIKMVKIEFDCCDFSGNNGGKKVTFKNCKFHKCYFSFSIFNDVNFTNCVFDSCSFAQTRFYRCIFDSNCTFYEMSISGGKTKFSDSEIDAIKLLSRVHEPYADKDKRGKYESHQLPEERYRLAKSIVKLSRNILESNNKGSNDELYYLSVKNLFIKKLDERRAFNNKKIHDLHANIDAKVKENKSKKEKERGYIFKCYLLILFLYIKFPFFFFEKKATSLFGFINSWGGSLQRLFFIGFGLLLTYCFIYIFMDAGFVTRTTISGTAEKIHVSEFYYIVSSLIKSFDITFLAGYTKHVTSNDSLFKQCIVLSNMLCGLFWYAVAIPSLINKISVTRL